MCEQAQRRSELIWDMVVTQFAKLYWIIMWMMEYFLPQLDDFCFSYFMFLVGTCFSLPFMASKICSIGIVSGQVMLMEWRRWRLQSADALFQKSCILHNTLDYIAGRHWSSDPPSPCAHLSMEVTFICKHHSFPFPLVLHAPSHSSHHVSSKEH